MKDADRGGLIARKQTTLFTINSRYIHFAGRVGRKLGEGEGGLKLETIDLVLLEREATNGVFDHAPDEA